MRLLLILAAAPLAASATAAPAPPSAYPDVRQAAENRECRGRADVHRADAVLQTKPAKPQRLGELPPGQMVLTVWREFDRCPERVIVGQRYGFEPQEPAGAARRR